MVTTQTALSSNYCFLQNITQRKSFLCFDYIKKMKENALTKNMNEATNFDAK